MSNIEWTDTTWNPVVGCTPVSPGCLNCYAATMARRLEAMGRAEYAPRVEPAAMGTPYDAHTPEKTIRIAEVRGGRAVFTGDVRTVPERLTDPLKWRKPRRVFVNSMSDLFHEAVSFEFVDRVFAVMALCLQHTFQVLTKRPERMAEYLALRVGKGASIIYSLEEWDSERPRTNIDDAISRLNAAPLPNVWLGTSVERQQEADERIPHLLKWPAAVRFLSCEPLLGPVDLSSHWLLDSLDWVSLDWVIVGGESGATARPCDVGWIRGIVRQCRAAKVPVFVKQLGKHPRELAGAGEPMPMAWIWDDGGEQIERWYKPADRKGGDPAEWPEDLRVREFPAAAEAHA